LQASGFDSVLTLYCLGDLRLERDGVVELRGRRKPLALIAWLLARGTRSASREEVADLLWGDSGGVNARKSLRQCLSELRLVLGDVLIEDSNGLRLQPAIGSDVRRFDDAFAASEWSGALRAWTGQYLADTDSLGGESWRAWLESERARLRRQLGIAGDRATAEAEGRGAWRDAVVSASQWRRLLPDEAASWAREIHGLRSSDRIAEALARLAEAEHHFTRTLDVALPEELSRLRRILSRLGDAGPTGPRLLTPDLVGRTGALARFHQLRTQSRGPAAQQGATLIVSSDEGQGKTRLLREAARQSRERGDEVIEAATTKLDRDRSYSVVRAVMAHLARLPASAGCSPETLATLAHVVPEIGDSYRHLPSVAVATPEVIAAAFDKVMRVVSEETPLVVLLDDFSEADEESIGLLAPVLIRPPAGLLAVVSGLRQDWRKRPALFGLRNGLPADSVLTLQSLALDDVRAMLGSMAPIASPGLERLTMDVHRLSGGNPALVMSIMRQAVADGTLTIQDDGQWTPGGAFQNPPRVPPDVDELLRSRFRALEPAARSALEALAVLASAPDHDVRTATWERLSNTAGARFSAIAEDLIALGIVMSDDRDGRVTFAAELYRLVALGMIAPQARQALHRRAVAVLRVAESATPSRKAAIAYHRTAAGPSHWLSPRTAALAASAVAVFALAGWLASRDSPLPVGTPVLLLDFENLTGDTTFDRSLQLASSVALQQSRQITVFPRSRVKETLELMRRPGADSVFDEALGREVAVREGLRRVVGFGISRFETGYVLTARIIDPSTGRDLFTATDRASSAGGILDALDRLVLRVRRATGEPLDSVRQYTQPLPRVTTASLAALHAYAEGLRYWTNRRADAAIRYFERAVELDSGFALAWVAQAEYHLQVTRIVPLADSAIARARSLSYRLTEREQLRLEASVAFARGGAEGVVRATERLAERYPDRDSWHNHGTALLRARRCPEAITALERAVTFDSTFVNAHLNIATCHQFLGDYAKAIHAYGRAGRFDSTALYRGAINHEFGIALLRGGLVDSARRVYRRMSRASLPQDRQFGYRSLGFLAGYEGRYRDAVAYFDTATTMAVLANTGLSVFRNLRLQAAHLLAVGDEPRARDLLDSTWSIGHRQYIPTYFAMGAALTYARARQVSRAVHMLDTIARYAREGAPEEQTDRALVAAAVALARGDARLARRTLLGAADTTRFDFTLSLLTDVQLALGRPDSAYQAAVQLSERTPFGTDGQVGWFRALLLRGQLAEELGLRAEAMRAFQRLTALWSLGDTDLPALREARRGLQRLTGTDSALSRPVNR
jgi:DNA-binding SARP family transcriptional activator/tetratricopeptide (TPR) repeat protein